MFMSLIRGKLYALYGIAIIGKRASLKSKSYKIIKKLFVVLKARLPTITATLAYFAYCLFLKIALKIIMKMMPPIHITSKISGVIWSMACML
jgi:hypothetical protein